MTDCPVPQLMTMIDYSMGKLWGCSGGELEFVSMRVEDRWRDDGAWYQVAVIRFTDHDVRAVPVEGLIDGRYYELTFPLAAK